MKMLFLTVNSLFTALMVVLRNLELDNTVLWLIFYIISGPTLIYYLFFSKDNILFNLDREDDSISAKLQRSFFWIAEAILLALFIQAFYLGNHTVPTRSMYPTIVPGDRFLVDMVSPKFGRIKRNNIYVFRSPIFVVSHKDRLLKRLIAMPGDEISFSPELAINGERTEIEYKRKSRATWIVPKKGDELEIVDITIRFRGSQYRLKDLRENKALMREITRKIDVVQIADSTFKLNGKLNGPIGSRNTIKKCLLKGKIILKEDFYFFLGDNADNSHDSRYFGFIAASDIWGRVIFRYFPIDRMSLMY